MYVWQNAGSSMMSPGQYVYPLQPPALLSNELLYHPPGHLFHPPDINDV